MTSNLAKINEQSIVTAENLRAYFNEHLNEVMTSGLVRLDRRKAAEICVRYFTKSEQQAALAKCSPGSFLTALNDCIRYGLAPTPGMECGYFIPYVPKNGGPGDGEVKFQLSYRGILEIARRNGVTAKAWTVHEGDEFEWIAGAEESVVHKPKITVPRVESTMTAAYVVAKFSVAGKAQVMYEVMSKAEIDAIRAKSPAKDKGPWVTDYIEMAKKTVIRRASKGWPLSLDSHERDDDGGEGENDMVDADFTVTETANDEDAKSECRVAEYRWAISECSELGALENVAESIKDDTDLTEDDKKVLRKAYAERELEIKGRK